MSQNYGGNRAQFEQNLRRKAFEQRLRLEAARQREQQKPKKPYVQNSSFHFEYSEWTVRRMAPFAILIHAMTILLFISWIIVSIKQHTTTGAILLDKNALAQVDLPKGDKVYQFNVVQTFPSTVAPLYSELEIEILDENYNHMYSFYKDLWQERHPNGNGGRSIYKDLRMQFEVELPKEGIYYVRAISYNKNVNDISFGIKYYSVGGLYFKFYSLLFGALSLILILGSQKWGSPSIMYKSLKKVKNLKDNMWFWRAAIVCGLIFIGVWVTALTHFGYAAAGADTILPTYFYNTNTVTYLG